MISLMRQQWGLTTCVCLTLALLLTLGTWQVQRLQWKLDLIEAVEVRRFMDPVPIEMAVGALPNPQLQRAAIPEYQPVRLSGFFVPGPSAHVFGTLGGEPGWYVFAPFQLSQPGDEFGGVVFVNRGFVHESDRAPTYPTPSGRIEVTGLLRTFPNPGGLGAAFAPPADYVARSLFRRSPDDLIKATLGALAQDELDQVAPFYIDAKKSQPLPEGGTTRIEFSNNHLGYAVTWFGLAVGLLVMYWFVLHRPRRG